MKSHHHLLVHTLTHRNTRANTTISSLHYTQPLIYKSAEHEIKLFNHRLLVHNTLIMRAIHFTGSLYSVPCKMRRNAKIVFIQEIRFLQQAFFVVIIFFNRKIKSRKIIIPVTHLTGQGDKLHTWQVVDHLDTSNAGVSGASVMYDTHTNVSIHLCALMPSFSLHI